MKKLFNRFENWLEKTFCDSSNSTPMKGCGGRMAGKTDEQRNWEYRNVPDEIPTFRQCLQK